MVELATELPGESLSATEIDRLRDRPEVSSVIELPTGPEHRRNVTSTATVLADEAVLYLTLDRECGCWRQRVLTHDADKHEHLETTLDQIEGEIDRLER